MRTQTKENVAMADELVLSHEDETQTHHLTYQVAQFAAVWIIFFTAVLAWSDAYWRSDWSNQLCNTQLFKKLLNDVIFIWLTDKKSIRISYDEKFT